MSHKLGVCIPYRNRKEHIDKLIPHLSEYLSKQGIEHKFYVGHQIDDKLFNRGGMKNIASHYAFEDGCDYVAWHDVDMLAENKDDLICDYSYPTEHPIHIATRLSKYSYGLGYDQYFGGVVLFTKEQAYQTNGYSNDYWDWGQEDDDLFYRCFFENYTTGKIYKSYEDKLVANFNGDNSAMLLPATKEISNCLTKNHTISILFKAEQQPDKVPIFLVGDQEKKYVEFPILRKHNSWTWGLSFNNSRTVNMTVFDMFGKYHNNWAKKHEDEWTWVTISYNQRSKEMYFYVNDELITNQNGIKENKPFLIEDSLKKHTFTDPLILGYCSNQLNFFKGQIAEVKIFNKFFEDVNEIFNEENEPIFNMDLTEDYQKDNVTITNETFNVIENIIPIRREGNFYCIHHEDEGFVDGNWKKGETTARNEKRFVTEMQQRKINYKEDGLKQIFDVLDVENVDETLYPNTMFINCKMRKDVSRV